LKNLLYSRYYNFNQLNTIGKYIFKNNNFKNISDNKDCDETGLVDNFYKNLENKKTNLKSNISNRKITEIIERDRMLRNINKSLSIKLINSMYLAIEKVLIQFKPKLIVSMAIDSYVLDLLFLICKKKKIKYIGLIASCINGYFRITAKGDLNKNLKFKEINNSDILKNFLKNNYTPSFNNFAVKSPLKGIFIRWIKNILRVPYFGIVRFVKNDKYNHHYFSSYLISKKHLSFFPKLEIGDKNWRNSIQNNKPILFMPLQMYPECPIDYWVKEIKFTNYYKYLKIFIKKFQNDFQIIIKEHPSVYPLRPRDFYIDLKKNNKVKIVPTYTNSNQLVDYADCIFLWSGTIGLDASIRGKPVLCLTKTFYSKSRRVKLISEKTSISEIKKFIKKVKNNKIHKHEQIKIMKNVTKNLYKGEYTAFQFWDIRNPVHINNMKEIGKSIKSFVGFK